MTVKPLHARRAGFELRSQKKFHAESSGEVVSTGEPVGAALRDEQGSHRQAFSREGLKTRNYVEWIGFRFGGGMQAAVSHCRHE